MAKGERTNFAGKRPILVAIVGGSGAGKTWLAEGLCKELSHTACHLSLDSFYKDRSNLPPAARTAVNFDNPRAIDWESFERVLRDCKCGKPTRIPKYDFATHTRAKAKVPLAAAPFVIIDGLWLLHRRSLRNMFDCRIFLECPADLRLSRRIKRDCAQRGRSRESVSKQFHTTVSPMHDRYVVPQSRWATVLIKRPLTKTDVQRLANRIKTLVKSS